MVHGGKWGVSGSSTRTHAAPPPPQLTFFFSFSWASSFRPTSFWSCRKMVSSFSKSRMRDSLALFCSASLSHSDTSRETRFSIALHGVVVRRKGDGGRERLDTYKKVLALRESAGFLLHGHKHMHHFSLTCNFFQVLPSPPAHGRAAPQVEPLPDSAHPPTQCDTLCIL